ncbi:uncharacterized protein LOC128127384 [Lactuca sativa]|uniref:uncharacterized protein LOC128127384 n=1 Tax=Lactuca sativa TaxID=4236 RepID=UPI0022AEA192|nr:uncharacterized protein LOC128127384 [Lactuca sativa]
MDSTSPCPDDKSVVSLKPYRPPLPFPIRAIPDEKVKAYRAFMEHVKALQVNIPFVETIVQTPKYLNLLKGLFTARKDMAEVAELVLNELPEKKGDSGSISVPCQFGNILATQALTDSGASINLMPFSFFKKMNLPEPRFINMKIHLADKTIIRPRGVCEDLLIKVDKFVFPVDFVVLDIEEDPEIPIILGRPFLNTACALIDVCESTLTLRVGDESAVFKAISEVKQQETRKGEVSSIDLDDEILQKELALLQEEDPSKFLLSSGGNDDVEKDLEEIEKMLKGTDSENTVECDEFAPPRRVKSTYSTSPDENLRNLNYLDLTVTSPLPDLDMNIFPNSLEDQAA